MTIGERIRQLRKELNLTQVELATRLRISGQSISKLEKGENNPSDQTITLICREFHVNEEWIRTGEGDPYPPSDAVTLESLVNGEGLDGQEAEFAKKFLQIFRLLRPETRQDIMERFDEIFGEQSNSALGTDQLAEQRNVNKPHEMTLEEMQAEVARQYAEEKEPMDGSVDFGSGNSGMATA